MIESLYSAVKRRRCGRATTSESRPSNWGDGNSAPAALPASPLRSEAANAAKEVLVLLVLFKVRFLSPPYSNCCGATCLTHVGTEGSCSKSKPPGNGGSKVLKETCMRSKLASMLFFEPSTVNSLSTCPRTEQFACSTRN